MPFAITGLIGHAAAAAGLAPVMQSSPGPFGRLSGVITAGVTIMSLAFAFLTHVGAFGWTPDPFIDLVASIAVGVVFGRGVGITEGQTALSTQLAERGNLNTALGLAAHARLDAVGAPAAPLDHTGTTIGTPGTSGGI